MVKGLVEHLRQAAEGKRFPEPSLLRAAAEHLEILDRAAELEPPVTQASPSSPPQAQIDPIECWAAWWGAKPAGPVPRVLRVLAEKDPPGEGLGEGAPAGSIEVDLIQEQASPRPGEGPGMWELERAGLERTIANLERENELLREEFAALERGCLACGAGPGRWCECS